MTMQTYKVFQSRLTNAEVEKVNAEGHDSVPKQMRRLDLTMAYNKTDAQKKEMVFEAWCAEDFDHVANVTVNSLEDVFCATNAPNMEKFVERLAPMHSLSVGDVVQDETGRLHLCDNVGFLDVAYQSSFNRGEVGA